MKRKASLYIGEILESIEKIEDFITDMDFHQMVNDDKTASAVIRKIELIGEAVKSLPEEVRNKYKEIPWSAMAKTRDKLIHFYHEIDYEINWKIIKEDLPAIKPIIREIYRELLKEESI